MSVEEQIQRQIQSDIVQAVRALANATATSHAAAVELEIATNKDIEHLWFLVRALCHEHGMDLQGVIERATNVAAERIERAQT